MTTETLIDDFADQTGIATVGTRWEARSDRVMGGVSVPHLTFEKEADRAYARLSGAVRTENNGGFIQMALSLAPSALTGDGFYDASTHKGVAINVRGNGEEYGLHLRTTDIERPWQSYRVTFSALAGWNDLYFDFSQFQPHRIGVPFKPARLTRLGIVAIGRPFDAEISVSRIWLTANQTQPT